jgi:hypothetical protein
MVSLAAYKIALIVLLAGVPTSFGASTYYYQQQSTTLNNNLSSLRTQLNTTNNDLAGLKSHLLTTGSQASTARCRSFSRKTLNYKAKSTCFNLNSLVTTNFKSAQLARDKSRYRRTTAFSK